MKVVIVCKSHNEGGAAIVSHRLMRALRNAGHDARMLVLSSASEDCIDNYSKGWRTKVDFLAERLQIFTHNGFSRSRLFMVDTASWGADISNHPWVQEADVINLNWINQGALSLRAIERLAAMGKRLVWTMHDMWNCTGICHHAYDCRRYEQQCGNCPYLGFMAWQHDLSYATLLRKRHLYDNSHIKFVAVSRWLADCCLRSSLMGKADISIIPNAFPIEDFSFAPVDASEVGIPYGKKVLIMGAARLDDAVKGFPRLIAVTKYMAENMPELAEKCHLLLFGGLRNEALLEQLALPYTYLGKVPMQRITRLYAMSNVVISTSHRESLGGTLVEGIACGCLAVTFSKGGQVDVVDHLETGYLAQNDDIADFVKGIDWAVNSAKVSREALNRAMSRRFSSEAVAKKYVGVFEDK